MIWEDYKKMSQGTSLREVIEAAIAAEAARVAEVTEARKDHMKPDIEAFFKTLVQFCREQRLLKVEIEYKAKEATRLGFFGVPLRGNRVEIPGRWLSYNKIEEAWIKLLTKWIFEPDGKYLIDTVKEMAPRYEFECEHSTGSRKDTIEFLVK